MKCLKLLSPNHRHGQLSTTHTLQQIGTFGVHGLSGYFFISREKKIMFQVMLFSMLHYSISQSNNSIFVHQRILSCLIVYYSLLPPYLLEPPLPPLLPSSASLMCSNHGDVSPLDSVRSGLEVKEPTRTSSFQKCKRMKSGRTLQVEERPVMKSQERWRLLMPGNPAKEAHDS